MLGTAYNDERIYLSKKKKNNYKKKKKKRGCSLIRACSLIRSNTVYVCMFYECKSILTHYFFEYVNGILLLLGLFPSVGVTGIVLDFSHPLCPVRYVLHF